MPRLGRAQPFKPKLASRPLPAPPADVTPPTASTWAAVAGGNQITATLSESGCVANGGGTTGSGGFTLTGTPATVASWSISGTTLTLILTNLVYQGEIVTVAYARAGTTDDIKDAAGNFLADISATGVTNNSTQTGSGAGVGVAGLINGGLISA